MEDILDINKDHNLVDIVNEIAKKLGVNSTKFIQIIEQRIPIQHRQISDKLLLEKILLLLQSDTEINQFETRLKNPQVLDNFKIMKERLAELQVLALVKKLEKSETCDDVLNSFLVVLNNKFEGVNNVLVDSLNQTGGGNNKSVINYYSKYLKYKLKNHKIENLINM